LYILTLANTFTQSNPRKNLEISVDDVELQDFFGSLDDKNVATARKNSQKWFKKELSEEQIRMLYRPILTKDPTGRYSPLLRVKVDPNTKIYVVHTNEDGVPSYTPGGLDDIGQRDKCTPIVKLGGLWFISQGFGLSINCTYPFHHYINY
jgi:hypothetical protein